MTPKLFSAQNPPLTEWTWLVLSGPDAQDFLHRVTTVDARHLEIGHGAEGCLLNPLGKIRAVFNLWRFGPTDFAFELDSGPDGAWKRALIEAIDQLTFSERQNLTEVQGLGCRWIFDHEDEGVPLTSRAVREFDSEIRICVQSESAYGRPWMTAWGRPSDIQRWTQEKFSEAPTITSSELEVSRIRALRPRSGHELLAEANPLEIGLGASIAKDKGCYPGQETIERTIAIGSPARRLVRVEGNGPSLPAVGSVMKNLADPPAEVGTLTSVASTGDHWEGLAIVRKIHAKEGLDVRVEGVTGSTAVIRQVAPYV